MDVAPALLGIPAPTALHAVPTYKGYVEDDAHAWLDNINQIADLYSWPPQTRLKVGKLKLTDAAQRWSTNRQFADWYDFQRQFVHRFGETKESAIARLEQCCQLPQEAVQAYADRFLQEAARAGRQEDDALMYQFICRLRPTLRTEVARQRLHSIEDVINFCNYWAGLHDIHDQEFAVSTDTPSSPVYFERPENVHVIAMPDGLL